MRWGLNIEKSVVKLVLPLALPASVVEHEDITPAMVDGLGVITEPGILDQQDHSQVAAGSRLGDTVGDDPSLLGNLGHPFLLLLVRRTHPYRIGAQGYREHRCG